MRMIEQQTVIGSEQQIQAGDFHVDLADRTATLRGATLDLTSVEFDLLVFLIRHPKQFVTPQTKLATNWAGSAVRQTEFLSVLLSLRKKLACADPKRCYLRTEPWVCYRFDTGVPVQ